MKVRLAIRRLTLTVALSVAVLALCGASAEMVVPLPQGAVAAETIRQLIRDGRYAEAESAARVHLAAVERAEGCESLETARAIDLLVESLWRGGKSRDAGALELAEEAIAIRQNALGDSDPELSDSLSHVAIVYGELGRHKDARRLFEQALAVATAAHGAQDDRVARIHLNLGSILREVDPLASEGHFTESLRLFEDAEGPESPRVAEALNDLANIWADRGQFAEAEEAYARVLRIKQSSLGPEHPDVAVGFANLGYLHVETGDYETARDELERALAIREKSIGREHPATLQTLGNLAIATGLLGFPAEPLWEDLLNLADRSLGPGHPFPAGVRANFAVSLSEIDPIRARRLNEEAYDALVRVYGPAHPRCLWVLSNLGEAALREGDVAVAETRLREAVNGLERAPGAPPSILYAARRSLAQCLSEKGATEEARKLFTVALAAQEGLNGPVHPQVASALTDFGEFLRREGDVAGASTAFERALAIREKALGPEHPDVGDTLFALADLEAVTGRLEAARGHFRSAIAIEEKARAPEDPRNAKGYRNYAACLLRSGEAAAALEAALKAEAIASRMLRATLAGVPERQALGLVAKTPSGLGLAVAAAVALRQPDAAARALDALVRSRALVLDEMSQRRRSLRGDESGETAHLFDAWVAARDRLARLTVLGEDEKSPQRYRARLEKARADKDAAERALADRSWEFRNERSRDAAGLPEVRAALPPGSSLVAFVKYPRISRAKAGAAEAASAPPVDAYAAFVLRQGARAPDVVPLGAAKAIDAAVASMRDSMVRTSATLGGPGGTPVTSYRRLAVTLGDLAWRPLERHLAGTKTAFVVPDGSLQLVSFAALPCEADAWLLEKGPVFHYLSAERDLVPSNDVKGAGLLVAGSPDFDSLPLAVAQSAAPRLRGPEPTAPAALVHRGPPPSCRSFASLRFPALPASLGEVEEIAGLWRDASASGNGKGPRASKAGPPLLLSGAAASERAVKENAPGRRS